MSVLHSSFLVFVLLVTLNLVAAGAKSLKSETHRTSEISQSRPAQIHEVPLQKRGDRYHDTSGDSHYELQAGCKELWDTRWSSYRDNMKHAESYGSHAWMRTLTDPATASEYDSTAHDCEIAALWAARDAWAYYPKEEYDIFAKGRPFDWGEYHRRIKEKQAEVDHMIEQVVREPRDRKRFRQALFDEVEKHLPKDIRGAVRYGKFTLPRTSKLPTGLALQRPLLPDGHPRMRLERMDGLTF
jgi:hypothetical protein